MPLRLVCLCFSADRSESDEDVAPAYTTRSSAEELTTRRGTNAGQNDVSATGTYAATSGPGVSAETREQCMVNPSHAADARNRRGAALAHISGQDGMLAQPARASSDGLESCPTLTPRPSAELANLADDRRIPGITIPASASVPASFENHDPTARMQNIKGLQNIKGYSGGHSDAGVAIRQLGTAQCAELCGSTSQASITTTSPNDNPDSRRRVDPQQLQPPFRRLSLPLTSRALAAAAVMTADRRSARSPAAIERPQAATMAATAAPQQQNRKPSGAGGVSSLVRAMEITRKLSHRGPPTRQGTTAESAAAPPVAVVAPVAVAPQGPAASEVGVSIFTTAAAFDGGGGGNVVGDAAGAPLVPAHYSAPTAPVYNSRTKLPYLASRHMSQVAFMQMFHVGDGLGGSSGGGDGDGADPSQQLQLHPNCQQHHLWTLDLAALSREITALRWIGQGGGGAVFQGVWQGASVAVKFLLIDAEAEAAAGGGGGGMDALALEGVVSSVVNHPNVVHTFAFQCARLTEASFAVEDDNRMDSMMDDQGNRDLFESLLDTTDLYGGCINAAYGNAYGSGALRRAGLVAAAAGPAVGGYAAPIVVQAAAAGPARSGRGGGAYQLTRFGSTVEDAGAAGGGDGGGGAAAAAAAIAAYTSDADGGEGEADEGQRDVRPPRRDTREGCTAVEDVAGDKEGSGSGGGSGGGGSGEGRRRALATAASDRLRARAATRSAVQAQQHQQQQMQQQQALQLKSPPPTQQQQQQQRQEQAAAAAAALDSTFHSEEGFGDPESGRGWNVRQALQHLKARPGMHMTYIIMEHCDRGSLLAAIRRGIFRMDGDGPAGPATAAVPSAGVAARFSRRIVLRAVLRTARDIAQGMCHLHSNGIIHGDLKPGNVLLRGCRSDRRGFVAMVADFGLSKVTRGDKPLEAHHWSTITVMAPEVIMGRWLKASDVFSYGVLLWQLVTGEPVPYAKLTIPQILLGVSQGTLKPEWPSMVHPALVRLGRACLETAPEKRPSFEAVVKILTKIEQHMRNELRVQRIGEAAAATAATAAAATAAATVTAAVAAASAPAAYKRG